MFRDVASKLADLVRGCAGIVRAVCLGVAGCLEIFDRLLLPNVIVVLQSLISRKFN